METFAMATRFSLFTAILVSGLMALPLLLPG